ncbi:MAG: S41 family peptidase [Bacteroidales bacterium]
MKRKIILLLLIPLLSLSIFAWKYYNDQEERERERVIGQTVLFGLKSGHYLKKEINDELSKVVFDLYIESLDPTRKFLLKDDIDKLKEWRTRLDEQLGRAEFTFFDLSVEIIEQRLKEVEPIYKEVLAEPFDFKKDEEIELDPEKQDYAANMEELTLSWRKALKYQTMVRLNNMIDRQEKALEDEDTTYVKKTFAEMEKEAREKVSKRQKEWFENLEDINRSDRFTAYYNALANAYGPHTGYYPPKLKENFDINISGKLEGIGAQLTRRDGYVNVVHIVPGSASWKQGDLKSGDKILKVAQEEEDPVDVIGMRLDDVVELIRGEKGTEVTLTVEKADGSIKDISIIRDVVVLEETYARSAILKRDKSNTKIGYLHLPKFYTDFNDKNGRNCSDDVAIELEKLKTENVDGLIVDLRNNGGGSLPDVVKIAGLFLDKGPVVQIKAMTGESRIMKDHKAGALYDGPLVILVNQGSASASEILAAAMQDYGRAVIVGSPSTFGKGTVQRFFDLDQMVRAKQYEEFKPLGSIKLTTQKFYRVNGGATQLKGVKPDIVLPDRYAYVDVGEKVYLLLRPQNTPAKTIEK